MALRRVNASDVAEQIRPEGKLIWVYATTTQRILALRDLTQRLRNHFPDLTLLTTWPADLNPPPHDPAYEIIHGELPEDSYAAYRQFLDRWQPDLCIWSGGDMRRGLNRVLRENDIPSLLVDVLMEELPNRTSRLWPDSRGKVFNGFTEILTPQKLVAEHLIRTGVPDHRITVTAPLSLSACPPSCADEDLSTMQKVLAGRPIWLASHVKLQELTTILNAHRKALKLLHRLLLVVSLENWSDLEAARAIIRGAGLSFADWEIGEEPEEHNQVLLCDSEDLGLWYRLAPVTLIASSLERVFCGQSPLDAAALGSAILFGKGISEHTETYEQLKNCGAAQQVRSMGELSDAVITLSAPDLAAQMALAGWTFVTKGAETTDQLLEITQDLLDMPDMGDETT